MKKKIGAALLVLAALLTAYSVTAFLLLRGLGAYRLSTGLGRVLSVSWQYTALAALLIWLLLAAVGLRKRDKKQKLAPASGKQEKNPAPVSAKKIPPAKGSKNPAQTGEKKKIPPAAGMGPAAAEEPQTVLLEESSSGKQSQPQDQTETVLMEEASQAASGENAALSSQPEAPAPKGTVLLEMTEKNKVENVPADQTVLLTRETLDTVSPASVGGDTLLMEEQELPLTDGTELLTSEQLVEKESADKPESAEGEAFAPGEKSSADSATVLMAEEMQEEKPQNMPEQVSSTKDDGDERSAAAETVREEQTSAAKTEERPGVCPSCGAELMPGRKFCIKCGYRIGGGV
ncbi:zinc ribbon domain-containing protein [Angelakisella massiliensis]|uniref:zinc ribbon domain-containing protein n=1 Tax=Angelakisella massiliensis TaxID=1871018 RepID=UPI0023A89DE7|nr:zinc ribbon domain-containing protein [Angelakisella massiliensis]